MQHGVTQLHILHAQTSITGCLGMKGLNIFFLSRAFKGLKSELTERREQAGSKLRKQKEQMFVHHCVVCAAEFILKEEYQHLQRIKGQ